MGVEPKVLFAPLHPYRVPLEDWLDTLFSLFGLKGLLHGFIAIQEFGRKFGDFLKRNPSLQKHLDYLGHAWVTSLKPLADTLHKHVTGVYDQMVPIIGDADARIWADHLYALLDKAMKTYQFGPAVRFLDESIEAWIDMMRKP